jgi:hypothetical protein
MIGDNDVHFILENINFMRRMFSENRVGEAHQ